MVSIISVLHEYFYSIFIICLLAVKWFKYCKVAIRIQLNSNLFTRVNDPTVLFLTIQFSRSHLFAHCFNIKQFYLTHREEPSNNNPARVNPGMFAVKGYSIFPRDSQTVTSPSDNLMSYQGHSLRIFTPPQRCSRCILQPQLAEFVRNVNKGLL